MPMRPPSSVCIATRKPLPSSWRSRSRPTSAPSITRSFVTDELRPSFSSSRVMRTWSASRMNALTPRAAERRQDPCARRAGTCRRSAPFVIHCFAPVMRQPSPSALGARLQRARVGACLGLGERERAEMLAARERRDEARLLLRRSEVEQRERDGARVHRDGDADARVRARELFEHEDVRDEVGAGAAVLLRHARAHRARARRASRRARAGTGARDPTRRRAARSPRAQSRGRAPAPLSARPKARSPRQDYMRGFTSHGRCLPP